MKPIIILLLTGLLLTGACKSDKEILPSDTWSAGCAVFAASQDGYKLSGMCCEYVTIPKISLKRDKTFSANAVYHAFTGAGFSDIPTEIRGKLSSDGKKLELRYEVMGQTKSYLLESGATHLVCDCFCD